MNETITEKICINCKQVLPIKNFYSSVLRRKKIYSNYSSRCKQCSAQYYKNWISTSCQRRATVLLNTAKSHSKRKNTPFFITVDDIINQYEIQNGKCYYSGRELSYVTNDKNIMSIDRINPELGYTKNNIVLCCWRVNKMKAGYTTQDFMELCKDVVSFSSTKNF